MLSYRLAQTGPSTITVSVVEKNIERFASDTETKELVERLVQVQTREESDRMNDLDGGRK